MQHDELTAPCPILVTAARMQELDRRSIEEIGIPGAVLMENAGRATVDAMEQAFGPVRGAGVCILAGPGNNGGDGLVMARCIHDRGGHPLVLLLADPQKLPRDAALNWAIVQRLGLPARIVDSNRPFSLTPEDLAALLQAGPLHSIVDALFGIGLARPLEGIYLDAVRCINSLAQRHACPVVAADIPSGLASDSGQVLGEAVRATLTVAYGLAKPGHVHHGAAHVGRLQVVDIGIPAQLVRESLRPGLLLDDSLLSALGRRAADSHKGSNGHVLIIAGSNGKTGAALLATQGAMRSGAGLVSCAVPAKLAPIFAASFTEAMYPPLPGTEDAFTLADYPLLAELCHHKQALVLGPGIGTAADTAALVLRLYRQRPEPMVVDADALNILAAHREALAEAGGPRLFTPHPGEMARLLDCPIATVQADRLAAAEAFCRLCAPSPWPMLVALKGAGTVVLARDGRWAINASGNPGMGSGGMGDVLAGVLAGLLAQGYSPWSATCAGVWLHGAAADALARERPYGYTASEVAAELPRLVLRGRIKERTREEPCSTPKIS